jgi:putative FmdB family regulatory protein
MPIYEFECRQCGKGSEILVRSRDWEGAECPHCGSRRLEKRISVFASSSGTGSEPPPVCGMQGGRGCGCGRGGPHRH